MSFVKCEECDDGVDSGRVSLMESIWSWASSERKSIWRNCSDGNESCESRRNDRGDCGSSSFSYTPLICFLITSLLFTHQVGPTHGAVNSPPLIVKQPPTDLILFQVAQRVDENDKPFIIECEAEGHPEPQYWWIKNGKDFNWQTYDDRILQQPGRGTLVVTQPRDEDIGQYQCFAYNVFGTATSNSVFLRKAELNSFKDDNIVETIIAEEGKPFHFSCNAPDGWPKPRVDWMLQNAQGAFKNINSSRITVDPEGTLWFSNVTRTDRSSEFNYACSAYSPFRHEYKLGNRVYLSVNPTSASSTQNKNDPTIQYMSKRPTVAIRGQTLQLWCIVGGTPLPEIRWSRDAAGLPRDRHEYDDYGKSLKIKEVDFVDAGKYTCDASNGVGQPISYSIDVVVQSVPYFIVEPEVVNAAEDETIEFSCVAKGEPGPIISWIHNGKPIEQAPPNPRRSLEGNKIVIQNILKADTGNYGCNASSPFGYVYKDVYLNVLALPPEITEFPKDVVAMEGTSALLTCRVFGAPRPTVRWIRKQEELSGGKFHVLLNGDLNITSVGFPDAGPYSCYATNKFGNASASGELVVKSPTVIKDGPSNYQVAAGNPVKFSCTAVSDDTLPLTIEWLNDGTPIDFDANPRYVKLQDNSLTIDKTTELDSGQYTCLAKTEFDNATADASLIVQDVPNRPELVSIECRPRDAAVRWKAMGDNRAPVLHYIIQFNTSFTPDSWKFASNVPASESSYTVSMKPWGNYTFRVIAKNNIGSSIPSAHSEVCTTSEDVPFTNPENVKADKTEPQTLRITWTPMPEIDHNAPRFKYEVQWKEDDELHPWKMETIHNWRTSELIVPKQPVYRPYLIKVRAVNEKGHSNVAPTIVRGFSGQDTPTEAPSNFTLLSKIDSKTALVSWNPVNRKSLQGNFEGYKIETWTEADGEDVYRTISINDDVTQAVVDKLIPYSRNFLRVFAYNSDHQGPPSVTLEVITDEGTPGPVDELDVRPLGVSSLHLKWQKPDQPNGVLLGYQIKYVRVIGTQVKWNELKERRPNISHPAILNAKLAGLESDTVYRIYVSAYTKMGAGEESFREEKTFAENATIIAKPNFQWDHERSLNGLAAVRVNWRPNFEAPGRPGSHFYVQYKEYGRTNWESEKEVFNEDFDVIRGLEPGRTYVFRVVAVDGEKSMPSDEQEIYTYAIDAPTRRAKEANTTTGWFIGLIVAIAFLVLILILVCIIKRNRGGKYAVYEREIAHGRLDYDEGGFREYAQPPADEPSGRTSLTNDFKPPPESDTESMVEYGDEAKFTEDGSFIGQYGVKKKDPNLPSPLATFV